jgi:spore coat polysaccharide biosynthesis protein SpsF
MKVVTTVEARMKSSRLPGKVLLPVLGRPLLSYLVERLRRVASSEQIVLATTLDRADDVLADFAAAEGIACFRGSEDDVMGRVIGAARSVAADVVVEITADCPIIDPEIIEETIAVARAQGWPFVSSSLPGMGFPDGMDAQVVTRADLERSYAMTDDPLDREHVIRHIINHPESFPRIGVPAPPDMHWPGLGLTLDEPKDYELLSRILEHFAPRRPHFGCRDVIRVLKEDHPEWVGINDHVTRKQMT